MAMNRADGHRYRRAFTMIDLLVVLLIVCLLSGMVFSAGGLMRAGIGQSGEVRVNLKMIGLAIQLYSRTSVTETRDAVAGVQALSAGRLASARDGQECPPRLRTRWQTRMPAPPNSR